jgi:hypothetical protein
MSVKLGQTTVTFPNSSTQSTKYDSNDDVGQLMNIQTWTGNGTWTKQAGCRSIRVMLCGGGGGGSGHGQSGGAGGYSEKRIDVSSWAVGTNVSITIGGQGSGAHSNDGAGTGGTTSFGSYLSATGGQGANSVWGHCGGHGGVGSGGDINLRGGGASGHDNRGGRGGASFFGGSKFSGWPNHHFSHQHEGHVPPGAGGCGEHVNHSRGAYGASGICIVYNYN